MNFKSILSWYEASAPRTSAFAQMLLRDNGEPFAFILISYLAALLPAASGLWFSIEVYELFCRPHWSSDRVEYPKIHI